MSKPTPKPRPCGTSTMSPSCGVGERSLSIRLLASLFVLFGAIAVCSAERRATLDEAAQDYVHLVLEIGAHEKGFVDAYFGPPEWRIEAEAHPHDIAELKAEADRIQ